MNRKQKGDRIQNMDDWYRFLFPADEWFVAYALIPVGVRLTSVTMFCIGHTVELYLKAVYAKDIGSVDDAIGYVHKIKGLWDACKSHDRNFMPGYEIRDSVFEVYTLERDVRFEERLSKSDFESYSKHAELYLVAKYLPELKYFWAPFKKLKGYYSMVHFHPNPYWVEFIRDLRRYLRYSSLGISDSVKLAIDEGNLPSNAQQYLRGLYV